MWVLSRDLVVKNHYPAIDVSRSISRVMNDITSLGQRENAGKLKAVLATYKTAEDLINIGAYVSGSNPRIDYALRMIDPINAYLCQEVPASVSLEESVRQLDALFAEDATA